MRAITYSEYGDADVLQLTDQAKPSPRDNEVLIRVHAAEATKGDTELRSFRFPVKWFVPLLRLFWGLRRPRKQILGGYFAGVIEAVGSKVARFSVGDEVFGGTSMHMGAYGEYVALPESNSITRKPKNMSFDEAAAVPLGGLNALHFMRCAKIQPGETVLINGAGGSIGLFAAQIARAMGAHVVGVDAPHKKSLVLAYGADEFLDFTEQDFYEQPRRYDVIFDMVVGSPYSKCLDALNRGGRYLTGNPTLGRMLRCTWTNWFSDKRTVFTFAEEKLEQLEDLRDMIEAGLLRAAIDQVFPLAQAADAHRRVETEKREGIVVLSLT